jgi:hypothetical protein
MQVQSKTDKCAYEIGDGTIPPGFKEWTAGYLIAAIKEGRIGAEHADLWMYVKLKSGKSVIAQTEDAITNKGKSYWTYCSPKGGPAQVEIINTLDKPLTVVLRGPTPKTVTIAAGGKLTIELDPGNYEYELIVPGYEKLTGSCVFSSGPDTWRITRS